MSRRPAGRASQAYPNLGFSRASSRFVQSPHLTSKPVPLTVPRRSEAANRMESGATGSERLRVRQPVPSALHRTLVVTPDGCHGIDGLLIPAF
jgi:hypothetical protein